MICARLTALHRSIVPFLLRLVISIDARRLMKPNGLFAAAIEPKELVIFSGAAHVDLLAYSPKHYASAVLSFLNQHLTSSPTENAQVQSRM
jgi:hypothetical protein